MRCKTRFAYHCKAASHRCAPSKAWGVACGNGEATGAMCSCRKMEIEIAGGEGQSYFFNPWVAGSNPAGPKGNRSSNWIEQWNILWLLVPRRGFGGRKVNTFLLLSSRRWNKFHRWCRSGLHRLSAGAGIGWLLFVIGTPVNL